MSETTSEIVLDASAAVRGLLRDEGSAFEVVAVVSAGTTAAHVPDLFVAEVTNAFVVRARASRWPAAKAALSLDVVLSWPLVVQACRPLAVHALEAATRRGLSAYDAFYTVLARELDIPLVTADRRLAEAVPGAVLVS